METEGIKELNPKALSRREHYTLSQLTWKFRKYFSLKTSGIELKEYFYAFLA